MKKIAVLLLSLVFVFALPFTALAVGEFADVFELNMSWEQNGYPDDVGGMYASDDGLVILMVDADDARQEEIRSMVRSTEGLSFGETEYSYKDLLTVLDEISATMTSNVNIHAIGIGWTTIDGAVTGFGESGKEFRVIVTVDESGAQESADALYLQYGEKIFVEAGNAPVLDSRIFETTLGQDPLSSGAKEKAVSPMLIIVIVLIGILAVTALYVTRVRPQMAMQTTGGDTVTTHNMSRHEVINAVKSSKMTPDNDLLNSIMLNIDESKK